MTNVAWKMAVHAKEAVKKGVEEFQKDNEGAAAYKVLANVRVVRKAPKEFFDLPIRVVEGFFVNKTFLYSSNETIIETVSGWIPHHPLPPAFMDKAISTRQLRAIGTIMARAKLAFDPKVHRSLSKIKLAVQAGKAAADAELSFTGTITFGKDCVTVGSKRFPFSVDANGYQRIKVGSQRMRVDVLRALLEAGYLPSSTM